MKTSYSVEHAQIEFPALIRKVSTEGITCAITEQGETSVFLVPKERMESLLETLEILASNEAKEMIAKYENGNMSFHELSVLDN